MKKVIVFAVIICIVCVVEIFMKDKSNTAVSSNIDEHKEKEITQTTNIIETKVKNQIFAVWLTYSEIGSLIKGKSEEEYRESLKELFSNLEERKINTVFYQCRAFCDSFYESEVFPVSKYISAENEVLPFDPFEVFLEIGEDRNIAVHCWVNPYRVSYDNAFENLPKNSPVRELYKENKNALIICDKGIYLNPADSRGRKLVLDGIRELLNKYKVDGIHFDDYFYPETDDLMDEKIFNEYKNDGGNLSLGEWRRENVSALVSAVYSLVKSFDNELLFSVSPSADIEKCRNVFYADVEKWCSEEGFVDYMIPQIYFGFENENMPFCDVVNDWENLTSGSNVKLLCGLAVYKCGKLDENAGSGKNEWMGNVNILSQQYEQIARSQVWQGFSLFSYSYCFGENMTEISKKEIKNLLYMVE